MKARLDKKYCETVRTKLKEELGLKNIMQVPRLSKVVVNIGVKDAVGDSKVLTLIKDTIEHITGQAAVKTKARKSIAGFKLREGMPIGIKVTLRGGNMYAFLDRLISVALPRMKDFQGVKVSFDGRGNYNLGIRDWMIFPEVDYETVEQSRGLNITIATTSSNDSHVHALLKGIEMPFKRDDAGKVQ